MTFTSMHQGFYRNIKVRRAGNAASWMWVASIGYACEHLTDGFVPVEALPELSDADSKPRAKLASRLVSVGLWEACDGGWMVHDFLKWNLSKEVIVERRAANLARVNKHRMAVGNGEGNASVMHYNERDNARSNGVNFPPPHIPSPGESKSFSYEKLPPNGTEGAGSTAGSSADEPEPKTAKKPKARPLPDECAPLPGTLAARVACGLAESAALRGIVARPNALASSVAAAFPALDLTGEITKASGWCVANPAKVPKSNGGAFLWRWFTNAQNKIASDAAFNAQRTNGRHIGPQRVATRDELERSMNEPDPLLKLLDGAKR